MLKICKLSVCGVAVVAILASGCELKKAADKMQNTSDRIYDKSEHISKRTDDLEAELTKKESHSMLFYHLDMLFGEGQFASHNGKKPNEADQVVAAGAAIQSMLFQYWKGDYKEDLAMLDTRFALTMKVFFARLVKHIPRDGEMNPFIPGTSFTGVAALGAMMDEMEPRYAEALERNGLPQLSLYNVIVEALKGRNSLVRNELLPKTSARILEFAHEAEYLLQLRHNFLPILVACRMTDLGERTVLGKWWISKVGFSKKIDLASVNPQSIQQWSEWLGWTLKTREDLRLIGIEPKYNSNMANIFSGLNFDVEVWAGDTAMAPTAVGLSVEDQARRQFADLYLKTRDARYFQTSK